MKRLIPFLLIVVSFLSVGCTRYYTLRYDMSDRNIVRPASTIPLRVQVATFTDARDPAERNKESRKEQEKGNLSDYTYDKLIKGDVAEAISDLVTTHLEAAGIFTTAVRSGVLSSEVTDEALKETSKLGFDAVLAGEVRHFYGFYDEKPLRSALLGASVGLAVGIPTYASRSAEEIYSGQPYLPGHLATTLGVNAGVFMESMMKRNVERHTTLALHLISTATGDVLWTDIVNIEEKERTSMPGINAAQRKFQVAEASLRDAVNELTRRLERSTLVAEQ